MARRFDNGKQIKLEAAKTPHGYLLAEAYPTRTGVLVYGRNDRIVRELRPPEEMVKALDQIARAPVTNVHRHASPDDLAHFEGLIGSEVVLQDDGWVRTSVQIMAAQAIKDIEANRRRRLSGGFDSVRFEETPGFWDPASQTYRLDGGEPPEGFQADRAEPFDGIQRDLRFSHATLCRTSRAGDGAMIRYDDLDEDDGVEVERYDVLKQVGGLWYVYSHDGEKKLSKGYKTRGEAAKRLRQIEFFKRQDETEGEMPVKITINEIEYEVAEPVARAVRDELKARNDALETVKAEKEGLAGEKIALAAERDGLKGEVEALKAEAGERHDAAGPEALNDRLTVLATARKVGVEYLKKDPMTCMKTNEEIMRDAVTKRYDKIDLAEASVEQIAGMFRVLREEQPARFDELFGVASKVEEGGERRDDADDLDVAYADMCKRMDTPMKPEVVT
jgi:hypothetical protein